MAKLIVYICDNCKKSLSKDGIGKPHLSINFGQYSGWVTNFKIGLCPLDGSVWRHTEKVTGIKQFCGVVCLVVYFEKLLKKKK